MTATKPGSSNLRKWTSTLLVAALMAAPIYPSASAADRGDREAPRPAQDRPTLEADSSLPPTDSPVEAGVCSTGPSDRPIALSGPGARTSLCRTPDVPSDLSELPVIGESVPGKWRQDLKHQRVRRQGPGDGAGTFISPKGPGRVDPAGRWLPGYRPVTAKALTAYKDWKKEQVQKIQFGETAGAVSRAPAGVHNRTDTYLTDPYMLIPQETDEGRNWVVREERAPVTSVNLADVREPDPDTPRAEKSYKSPYLRSGLTGEEYRALKQIAEDALETVDAQDADATATRAPTMLTGPGGFQAIGPQGGVPPDPIVAVGPNHIVAMVNSRTSIWTYDPTGVVAFQQTFDTDAFFTGITGCSGTFDPFVDYDEAADRFVIGLDSLVGAGPDSYYCVAASRTNDPTGLWWRTSIRSDASNTATWSDFPHMGIGLDAIYIAGNMFADGGGGFQETRVFALNKDDLYNGNPLQIAEDTFGLFTVQPVKIHGFISGGWPAPGTPHYFISHNGSATRIYGWTDPFNQPAFVAGDVSFIWNGAPPNADDGGALPNDTGSGDFLDAEFRFDKIYATRAVGCNIGGGGSEACVDWVVVDMTGGTPVAETQQSGGAFGSADVDRYMPDITVDRNQNIVLGYSRTSPTEFNDLYVNGRLFGDPAGQLQTEALQHDGLGQYTDGAGCGNGSCDRWGDYSGVAVAPDGCTVVHMGEYSDDIGPAGWNTNIGIWKFDDCSPDSAVRVNKGTYTCDDSLEITVTDVIPIDAATVSAQTTVTSGGDSETIAAGNWAGSDCVGADCSIWITSIPVSGSAGSSGDGTLNVSDGGTINVTYLDPHGTHDDQSRNVTVDCQTGFADGGFLFDGGFENGTGTELHRDYLDAGELVSYTFGIFNPATSSDLTDVSVSLSVTGPAAADITIFNPTIYIGPVAINSLTGGAFQIEAGAGAASHPLSLHDFNLSITSVADGKTVPQVLTQQVIVQADDVITQHSECFDFEADAQGWQNERYVDVPSANVNTVVAPWTRGGGCDSETRTDGSACNTGGTNAFKTNANAGSCGPFAQSPTTLTDDINYSPIITPAFTGNGASGEPYNWKWTSVEYFYESNMEVVAGGDIAAATGNFFSTDYQGISNPAQNEVDTEYDFFSGFFFYPNTTFNIGGPFDPDSPPDNFSRFTFGGANGLAPPGLQWRMALEVYDADFGSNPTTTPATQGLAVDNVGLFYDMYYAEGQVGVAPNAAGVVALDQFTYESCPGDVVGVSVLDADAGGSVMVTVTSDSSGDSETFTINAAGPYYAVDLPYSTVDGPVVNDGILNVTPNDTIRASYDDVSAAETVEDTAVLECPAGNIIIEQVVQISDNGDGDNFADTNETVDVAIRLANNGGFDLTNVQVFLFSDDPNIDCIPNDVVNFGAIVAGGTATNDIALAPFSFKVADATECTDPESPPVATLKAFILANEISGAAQPQRLTFTLDLDATGSVTTFSENFNSGQGSFTHELGEGDLNGAPVDPNGFTCTDQYIDEWFYRATGGSTLAGTPGGGMFLWGDPADNFPNGIYAAGLDGEPINDSVLLSKTFTIDAGLTTLNFDHQYKFGAIQSLRADGGVVNYRVNGGAWQKLDIASYDGNLITNFYCNPLCNGGPFAGAPDVCFSENGGSGENVFCRFDAQGNGEAVFWNQASGTVSGLTPGDQVQFRWRFGSMHSEEYGIPHDGGWAVDEILVTNVAELVCDAKINPNAGCGVVFESAGNLTELCGDGDANVEPTESWSVDVSLKNSGTVDAVLTTADLGINSGTAAAATVSGNPGNFGTILPGASASATYSFEVDAVADCTGDVLFDVTNVADNSQTYPSRFSAFSIATGGPGQMEAATQTTDPLDAAGNTAASTLTPAFTLASPVSSASLGYGFSYANVSPSELANQSASPIGADDTTTTSALTPAFTISGASATSAIVDWASLTYSGNNVTGCTEVFLRTPNGTDVTLKALGVAAAPPYDVLSTYQSVNGGPGTYLIGLTENPGGGGGPNGCNNNLAQLAGTAMTVDGAATTGSWTSNVQVSLWDGATETTLKAFGVADANPYDVSTLYTGPGTYELRIQENGAGGTASATAGSMTINIVECDQGCSALSVPGEASHQDVPPDLMLASYNQGTGLVDLSYTPACDASDHTIYYGDLNSVSTYGYTDAACSLGTSGTASFDPGAAGNWFFLVVGNNGVEEGSYGKGGTVSVERPEAVGVGVCDRSQNLAGVTCE